MKPLKRVGQLPEKPKYASWIYYALKTVSGDEYFLLQKYKSKQSARVRVNQLKAQHSEFEFAAREKEVFVRRKPS